MPFKYFLPATLIKVPIALHDLTSPSLQCKSVMTIHSLIFRIGRKISDVKSIRVVKLHLTLWGYRYTFWFLLKCHCILYLSMKLMIVTH